MISGINAHYRTWRGQRSMPNIRRRAIVKVAIASPLMLCAPSFASTIGGKKMYGLIASMKSTPGKRDLLVEILLEGVSEMPGCLSYVVGLDQKDSDALWVTEVWESQESHKASLSLEAVQDAIMRAKPLIASFGEFVETTPIGGHGMNK